MAKNINGGNINFNVNMNVNKNGLNQITKPLQQIQNKLKSMSTDQMTDGFKEAAGAAKQLESIINSSWNDKLGQLNLDKFNQSIKTSFNSVEGLKNSLMGAKGDGQAAFNAIASEVLNTNVQLRESNKLLDDMATSMANTVKWGITSSIFNNITGSIQKAYYYAKDLDSSLNNIRIVTGDSADQMQRFARVANNAAGRLGRSTLDYTKAALTFYQQGLSDEDVQARTEVSMKAQNITGAGSEIYDELTSVWNGFKVATQDTQSIVDKLAAVADNSASNMSQLSTAMSKVAATANVMGVDVDQLTAQIATVVSTTRMAPESVGTAFKTIYSRLNDIATGAQDAQVSLGNYSGKMADLGFNVLDATGHLRDTGQVIEEIGGRWNFLTKEQQVYLAQTMGGQRQITQVMALFDNWDKYLNNLNVSMGSQGTLMEKNNVYLESTEAHLRQLGTEAERTYDILFDQDTVNGFADVFKGALGIFNDFIDGFGGGTNAFIYFGSVVAGIFNKQIAQGIQRVQQNFERLKNNINSFKVKKDFTDFILKNTQASNAQAGITGLSDNALRAQAAMVQKIFNVQQGLTKEQQIQANQAAQQIALAQDKIDKLKIQNQTRIKNIEQAKEDLNINRTNTEEVKKLAQIRKTFYSNQIKYSQQAAKAVNQISWDIIGDKDIQALKAKKQEVLKILEPMKEQLAETFANAKGLDFDTAEKQIESIFQKIRNGSISGEEWSRFTSIINDKNNENNEKLTIAVQLLKLLNTDTKQQEQEAEQVKDKWTRVGDAIANAGKRVLNLQTGIKLASAAGQALTSIGGALETGLAEGATAADKLNATFTGINGTIGAILTAIPGFGPALNMVWQGVSSIGKAIAKATGVWDKWQDHFKTLKERTEQVSQAISKIGQVQKTENGKISSLEAIKEQYDILSQKAGEYGKNLHLMTQEQQDRYHELTNDFSQYNDAVIVGYDNQGNAIVENQKALQATIDLLKEQKQAAGQAAYGDAEKNLQTAQLELLLPDVKVEQAQQKVDQIKNMVSESIEDDTKQLFESAENIFESNFIGYMNFIRDKSQSSDPSIIAQKLKSVFDFYKNAGKSLEFLTNDKLFKSSFQDLENFPVTIEELIESINNIIINHPELLQQDPIKVDIINALLGQIYTTDGYNTQSLKNMKDAIDTIAKTYAEIDPVLQQAESQLKLAQQEAQKLNQGAISFQDKLIIQTLKYGQGYNQAFKQLQSSDLFDQAAYNPLIDYVSGFKYREGLEQAIVDQNGQKWASTYEQILDYGQKYAQGLYKTLTQYGSSIEQAQKNAVQDIQNIKNSTDQSLKTINTAILKSIQQNWLNNESIQQILNGKNEEQKQFIFDLIKSVYGLQDFGFAEIGGMPYIKNAGTKIVEDIYSILTQTIKTNKFNTKDLFTWINDQNYTEDQLSALKLAIKDALPTFESLNDGKNWIIQFFKGIDAVAQEDTTIEHFDKILSAIDKIQNGKTLTYKEQIKLAELLGIDDKHLAELQTNTDWLNDLVERVLNLEQGSYDRIQGIESIFPTLQKLTEARNNEQITATDYEQAWAGVYEKQLNALGLTEQALKDYAETKNLAFNSKQDKAIVIALYNQSQNLFAIGDAAQKAKQQIQAYGKGDATLHQSYDAINSVRQAWEALTGTSVTTDWIVQNIDAIAAAAKQSFETLQEFKDFVENYTGEESTPVSNKEKYDAGTQRVNQASGAKQSLTSGKALTDDQAKALIELQEVNQELANVAEQQGINSQTYINALQRAIKKQKELNEQARQGSLKELELKKIGLEQDLQQKQNREQYLQNEIQAYEEAKKILQETGHTEEQIANAKAVVDKVETLQITNKTNLYEQLKEVQKDIGKGQGDLNELKAQQLQLQQQINQQAQKADINKMQSVDELQSARLSNKITKDEFNQNLDDIASKQAKSLGLNEDEVLSYADALQFTAKEADHLVDSLEKDRDAALEVAIAGKRLTKGLEDLSKNFEKYQQQLTSDNLETFSEGLVAIKGVMGDLLNIDGNQLSVGFFQSAENLEYMRQAATGSVQAIDALRMAAATDIIQNCDVYLNGDQEVVDRLTNLDKIIQDFAAQDIRIGATINDAQFISTCNKMIADAKLTEGQIQAYFNSLGFDPKISYEEVDQKNQVQSDGYIQLGPIGPIPAINVPFGMNAENTSKIQVPKITALTKTGGGSFSAPITSTPISTPRSSSSRSSSPRSSSPKSGSSKSGSKSSTQKDKIDSLEDERDRYHNVDLELKAVNNDLEKLQKNQKKLYGKDLLNNINKQLTLLKKQVALNQKKLKIAEKEQKEIKKNLKARGVQFDSATGAISNYTEVMTNKINKVNKTIAYYNSLSGEQQKSYKTVVEAVKKDYEKFKKNVDKYDKLISDTIPGLKNSIDQKLDEQIELSISKFKMGIQIQLDMSKATKQWNEFKRKVIDQVREDDVVGNAKSTLAEFSTYYDTNNPSKGMIPELANHVTKTQKELQEMDRTGYSQKYGTNREAALADLNEYKEKLMKALSDNVDLEKQAKQYFYDIVNVAQDAFDEQSKKYDFISDIIEHDIKLMQLLYKEEAPKYIDNYYQKQVENDKRQLDFQRQQKDFWQKQMLAEKERMKNLNKESNAYKEAEDRFKTLQQHWMGAVKDFNAQVQASIDHLLKKYENNVDKIMDGLEKKLTNGKGLDRLKQEWEIISDNADDYLDKVNSMYEIQKLQNSFNKAINNAKGNVKSQKALNNLMNQQLKMLKAKDKLTKYDVDRANLLLQIELKRIALEESRNNKSKLRLRRDTQGNYQYQYTADDSNIYDATQDLADARNSLWNLDKEQYLKNLEDIPKYTEEMLNKLRDLYKQYPEWTEEAEARRVFIFEQYGAKINGLAQQNEVLRKNLTDTAIDELSTIYGKDVDNFKNMSDQEQQILMQSLVPQWNTATQDMARSFAGQGGMIPQCQDAVQDLDGNTKDYEQGIKDVEDTAGITFDAVKQGVDKNITATEGLVTENGALITEYQNEYQEVGKVLGEVDKLTLAYKNAQQAAIDAAKSAEEYLRKANEAAKDSAYSDQYGGDESPYDSYEEDPPLKTYSFDSVLSDNNSYNDLPDAFNNNNSSYYDSGYGNYSTPVATTTKSSFNITAGAQKVASVNKGWNITAGAQKVAKVASVNNSHTWEWQDEKRLQLYNINGSKKSNLIGWASGGYTGDWNDADGKLAILHKKELVLNEEDTKNILKAVESTRDMAKLFKLMNINSSLSNTLNGLVNQNPNPLNSDQNVYITASFPAVNSRVEIEQAFNNLINRASQYSFNTKK